MAIFYEGAGMDRIENTEGFLENLLQDHASYKFD